MSLSTSPVLAAAASNDLSQIRWLIERENVPVDFMGDWYAEPRNGGKGLERQKRTPCMVAASHGALEVLLYVLQMGADPNKRSEDEERCTAMHCAAAGGAALSTEAIKTLLLFGADRNARDMYGRVPADCLPGTASDMNANGSSDAGGSSSGGSASTGGNRGHTPSSQAVNSQAALQDPDEETLMSDEFRMYEFKIRRCSRTRAHDWTECPYTHPGEKARRRDPRRFNYCGAACPEFRKGSCPQGDVCEYAHGVFECWLHPSRYRTQLCKDGAACDRRACFFAHHTSQLRVPTDAFGNPVGNVSPNTPSPTGSGSPQGSPRQSSASLDWANRSSESESTQNSLGSTMMKGNLMSNIGAAFGSGSAFPSIPRGVDPMLLQSQYGLASQNTQAQYASLSLDQQSVLQQPALQQQRHQNTQQQMLMNYASMVGMNSMADMQGGVQGAFQLGFGSMMQSNGLFNQGDGAFQSQQQMLAHASNTMNSHSVPSDSLGSRTTQPAVNYLDRQQGLNAGAKVFTLPGTERFTPLRRNSSSFQHLGMIEGVLDGEEVGTRQNQ